MKDTGKSLDINSCLWYIHPDSEDTYRTTQSFQRFPLVNTVLYIVFGLYTDTSYMHPGIYNAGHAVYPLLLFGHATLGHDGR